jgi:hypothetical protein
MKPIDHSLRRLFKAANQIPKPLIEPMPHDLETRVLAQWRSQPSENEFALAGLFRRAVICAGLVMILSIVWGSQGSTSAAASVVALANYEINTHLPP